MGYVYSIIESHHLVMAGLLVLFCYIAGLLTNIMRKQ
jgi:hypothetical protein